MPTATDPVEAFLESLPPDKAEDMRTVRNAILASLPKGYREGTLGRTIGYVIPHSLFPAGYHCDPRQPLMFAALGVTKSGFTIHLMTLYGNPEMEARFRERYSASGKRLDMGKACIRFRRAADLELELVCEFIAATPPELF